MRTNRITNVRSAMALGLVGLFAALPAAAQLDLSWSTIDGGGATFSFGGGLQLGGTIGQPDAGPTMSGGGIQLTGGFWPGVMVGEGLPCIGDLDGDDQVTLADLTFLLSQFGCMRNCTADIDEDGQVGLSDLSLLLGHFGTICP